MLFRSCAVGSVPKVLFAFISRYRKASLVNQQFGFLRQEQLLRDSASTAARALPQDLRPAAAMQPAFLFIGCQFVTVSTHTDRYSTRTVLRRMGLQLSRRLFRSRRLRCPLQRRQAKSRSRNGKRDDKRSGKQDGIRNGKRDGTSASLIGRLRSSTFRLSATAVSMSLAGSRFSSESAPGPFHHGIRGRSRTIFCAALSSV